MFTTKQALVCALACTIPVNAMDWLWGAPDQSDQSDCTRILRKGLTLDALTVLIHIDDDDPEVLEVVDTQIVFVTWRIRTILHTLLEKPSTTDE